MNFKIIPTYAYFAVLMITICPNIHSQTENYDSFDSFLSDAISHDTQTVNSEESDNFDTILRNLTANDLNTLRSCSPGEASIWLLAIATVNLQDALNDPLYKRTSIPLSRNLLTYPNMQLCTYHNVGNRQFSTHLFYNQTFKKDFRGSTDSQIGTRIGSYLDIENKSRLNVLDQMFELPQMPPELRNDFKNIDTRKLVWTFGNAHLEERRFGFMGHFVQEINHCGYFEAKMPIYYMIRNLNFTNQEKDIIQRELSAFQGSDFDEDAFARQHVIMDVIGSGTLELNFSKQVWQGDNWNMTLGAGALIPTDYAFAKGLYGTYINPSNQTDTLVFCDLANITAGTTNPNAVPIIKKYFTDALDHLSSILLQCPLGYDHHLGFTAKMAANWDIRSDLSFNGLYSFDVFLPHDQQRFFIPQDTTLFSDDYNNMPQAADEQAQAKLAFLQDRMTTLLFPTVLCAKVFPGVQFTSTSCLQKTYRGFDFTVGYNGWYKGSEKLLKINKPSTLPKLDINKAISENAYAFKLFGKVHKLLNTKRYDDFSLSFWVDATLFNHAIGNDFSIGISLDSKF